MPTPPLHLIQQPRRRADDAEGRVEGPLRLGGEVTRPTRPHISGRSFSVVDFHEDRSATVERELDQLSHVDPVNPAVPRTCSYR